MIKFKLTTKAKEPLLIEIDCTPRRGHRVSASMDLCACIDEPLTILPNEVKKIMTGIHVFLGTGDYSADFKIPHGTPKDLQPAYNWKSPFKLAGLYLPSSSSVGLKLENTIGLLEADFMGESFVKYRNVSEKPILIMPGERLVQLIVVPVVMDMWTQADKFEEETERGEDGEGSTGKF